MGKSRFYTDVLIKRKFDTLSLEKEKEDRTDMKRKQSQEKPQVEKRCLLVSVFCFSRIYVNKTKGALTFLQASSACSGVGQLS